MYKLIIADDEKVIREGLKNLVRWTDLGFEVVSVFDDGDEVLEYLEYMPVDVVLTDIRMPHKSGIDIAKYVHQANLDCKVVFISGYKEFELAVQGMKYGVEDYILKPTNEDEVREIFLKLRKAFDARRIDIERQKAEKERLEKVMPLLEEKFVNDLIMGVLDNVEYIQQRMELLYPEIDSFQCPCMLVNAEIENYSEFLEKSWNYGAEQFDDAVYNFVKFVEVDAVVHVIYKHKDKIKIFFVSKKSAGTEKENRELCSEHLYDFSQKFMNIFKVNITSEIEAVFENVYKIVEERKNVFKRDVQEQNADLHLQEQKKQIMLNVMIGNVSVARRIMCSVLESLSEEKLEYKKQIIIEIFSEICSFLRQENKDVYETIQPIINYQNILNMSSNREIFMYCNRVFDKMRMKGEFEGAFEKNHLIGRVKKYINEHIFEDILLEDIAEELFVSTSHLSRIFKKQTGETFSQFVTKKKMDKAIEILRDNKYKAYQVGEMLGYKTPRHFSKLFNNYTGYYPSQYRKQVLNMGKMVDDEE